MVNALRRLQTTIIRIATFILLMQKNNNADVMSSYSTAAEYYLIIISNNNQNPGNLGLGIMFYNNIFFRNYNIVVLQVFQKWRVELCIILGAINLIQSYDNKVMRQIKYGERTNATM